jgi:STE24 endopeptidase
MPPPFYLILAFYLLWRAIAIGLTLLNLKHQAAHGHRVPPGFESEIDQGLLARMRDYSLASGRLGLLAAGFDLLVITTFFFGGLLDWYNSWLAARGWPLLWSGPLFFLLLMYAQTFLHLPFSLYRTFVLEERFGFNKQTPKLWGLDLLKGVLLSTLLATLLLTGSFWLILQLPDWWWLAVYLFFLGFNLFLLYLSPQLIEPLFNTFTPIGDEELAGRIREVLAKAGIPIRQVLTMDASRRSTHSNAYFSGIGRIKRIILFDTLLAKNSREEIIAIIAHEAGHWRKKHLLKRLLAMQAGALASIYLVFRLVKSEVLLEWFGLQQATLYGNLLLAGLLVSLLALPFQPLTSYLSRKHEQEADDYAVRLTGSPQHLAMALVKLGRDNLANLHPHPWFAAFYYSHPPLPRRVARLQARRQDAFPASK